MFRELEPVELKSSVALGLKKRHVSVLLETMIQNVCPFLINPSLTYKLESVSPSKKVHSKNDP